MCEAIEVFGHTDELEFTVENVGISNGEQTIVRRNRFGYKQEGNQADGKQFSFQKVVYISTDKSFVTVNEQEILDYARVCHVRTHRCIHAVCCWLRFLIVFVFCYSYCRFYSCRQEYTIIFTRATHHVRIFVDFSSVVYFFLFENFLSPIIYEAKDSFD